MKLTYGNQTVDLFDLKKPNKIILSVSGGLDSASLFYLICTNFPDMEVIPFTSTDKHAPFDTHCAMDIVQFMRETFPDHPIREHYIHEFDKSNWAVRKEAEDSWEREKVMIDGERVPRCNTLSGLVKILEKRKHLRACRDLHDQALPVTGMTKNPPEKVMKDLNFKELAEERRSYREPSQVWGVTEYQPYLNVDKRFVAGVFKTHGLMDTLFHMTGSCVGGPIESDYYTKECHQCFWCHEKKWAFNLEW